MNKEMNLPEINERAFVVRDAERLFGSEISILCTENKTTYNQAIRAYGHIIATLWSEEEHVSDAFEAGVRSLLERISEQYNLTYGEKTHLLASIILENSKYVIRWERHGTIEHEGD